MHLEKLDLQGFKSFANRTTLKFTKGITSVVGPNGSGKSNVADGIKWVLGEQSLKSIRGKKSEDVIFAGSKEKSKMGMAEVSLTLNNEDSRMPIDFPEVIITRRLFRDGESEYLINKNPARLMDIQDLLLKSGFGQKTYSVISQGQIGNILGATPQARKEMFDEAAGVKQFQVKRDSAIRKLERTRQNLLRVTDLLRELKPRLHSLQKQAERAKNGEVLARELKDMQTKLFAHLWDKYTTRLKESDALYGRHQENIEQVEKEIAKISQAIEAEEKRTASSREELAKLQRETDDAREQRNNLQQELALTRGKIDLEKEKTTGVDVAGLKIELSAKEKHIGSLEKKSAELSGEIQSAEKELAANQSRQTKLNQDIAALQQKLHQLQTRQDRPPEALGDLELEIGQVENDFGALVEKLMTCQSLNELENLKSQLNELNKKFKQLSARFRKVNGQKLPQQPDLSRWQQQLTAVLSEREQLTTLIQTIQVKLATQKAEHGAALNQIKILQLDRNIITGKMAASEKTSSGLSKNLESLLGREKELADSVNSAEKQVVKTMKALEDFNAKDQAARAGVFTLERQYRDRQNELNIKRTEQNQIQIERTKHQTRREDIDREMLNDLGGEADAIKKLAEDKKHRTLSKEEELTLHTKIDKNKRQLEIIGQIDPAVIEEHKHLDQRVTFLDTQSTDLRDAADKLKEIIKELDQKIKKEFEQSFEKINLEFSKYFQILFGGGEAKLALVKHMQEVKDEDDETKTKEQLVESIEISAVPPGKKMKNINMLSGGEKTMTSIALLMAIITNNPSPFVVLDEVDAALDEANSRRYAKILSQLAHQTQFIVITHNRETMRQAGILYGVTMERNGVSKILSVKLEKAEEIAQ